MILKSFGFRERVSSLPDQIDGHRLNFFFYQKRCSNFFLLPDQMELISCIRKKTTPSSSSFARSDRDNFFIYQKRSPYSLPVHKSDMSYFSFTRIGLPTFFLISYITRKYFNNPDTVEIISSFTRSYTVKRS